MPDNDSELNHWRFGWLRRIRGWLAAILITGGILAVVVDHVLDRLAEPETILFTDVTVITDPSPSDSRVNAVTHQVLLRNDGDTAFTDLSFRIKFSPTAGKPTIGHPVKSARPDAILDVSTDAWINPNVYGMDIGNFAPTAEISLTFDSDQILTTTIDVLGDGMQITRVYNQD